MHFEFFNLHCWVVFLSKVMAKVRGGRTKPQAEGCWDSTMRRSQLFCSDSDFGPSSPPPSLLLPACLHNVNVMECKQTMYGFGNHGY